ncbi:hypothetical protein [Melittangium boletus]|uniref:hypothetical protein n=1 Tax=Melittangium boletus TaxID=83453 RepID=UPI003DA49771
MNFKFSIKGSGKMSASVKSPSHPTPSKAAGPAASGASGTAPNKPSDGFEPTSASGQYLASLDNGMVIRITYSGNGTGSGSVSNNGQLLARAGADLSNDLAQVQLTKGGWSQTTPPFTQQTLDDCGPAVVSMLAASRDQVRSRDGKVQMGELRDMSLKDGKAGSSPKEMGRMLASAGLEVTQGVAHTDPRLISKLDASLQQGHKVVALVDSDKIDKGGGTGSAGTAHWVIVDGKDESTGKYLVKNPATGKDYYLSPQQLQEAFTGGGHKGGGFVSVKANTHAGPQRLRAQNTLYAAALGNTPGTGSKGGKNVSMSGI